MGLRRSTSSPCVSLLTTSGGRAALGADSHETPGGPTLQPAPLACAFEATTDGRGIIAGAPDREIWQRMESSSALNSCSDLDDAPAASDEDDEERTMRRLAQRRMHRLQTRKRALSQNDARHASDARLVMQERIGLRRTQSLKRKPSALTLELAADRDVFAEKENVPPPFQSVMPTPLPIPLPPRDTYPVYAPVQNMRRTVSASSAMPSSMPSVSAPAPRVASTHWQRTSSARDSYVDMSQRTANKPEFDDSGFFEDSPPPPHITEHDRQAVELLLGLGRH